MAIDITYVAVFREPATMTYRGSKRKALRLAKYYGMEIAYENHGSFVFETPMQALIIEYDEGWQEPGDGSDAFPYIQKVLHPGVKKVTKTMVYELVDLLNEGKVQFTDVMDAAGVWH